MADDVSRIELGFDGGLIVITKVEQGEWAKLEKALTSGSGIVQLAGADETSYYVDVSKLSYVKHEAHVGRVGF